MALRPRWCIDWLWAWLIKHIRFHFTSRLTRVFSTPPIQELHLPWLGLTTVYISHSRGKYPRPAVSEELRAGQRISQRRAARKPRAAADAGGACRLGSATSECLRSRAATNSNDVEMKN